MPVRRLLPLLLLPLCLPAGGGEAEDGWRLKKDKDGIAVYLRELEDSKYKAFKGVTVVAASVPSLVAVLDDTEACPEWLHRCEEGQLLEKISPTERIFYQVTDLPFPIRSRDAIFHAKVSYLGDGKVLITTDSLPDYRPKARKRIRIRHASGSYLLEPVAAGTRITWTQQADPAGRLPAWLVNAMLTDMPLKSLKALSRLANHPPYRDAAFVYDDQGTPLDLAR